MNARNSDTHSLVSFIGKPLCCYNKLIQIRCQIDSHDIKHLLVWIFVRVIRLLINNIIANLFSQIVCSLIFNLFNVL